MHASISPFIHLITHLPIYPSNYPSIHSSDHKFCNQVIAPGVGDRKSLVWQEKQREHGEVQVSRRFRAGRLEGFRQEPSVCASATLRPGLCLGSTVALELAFQALRCSSCTQTCSITETCLSCDVTFSYIMWSVYLYIPYMSIYKYTDTQHICTSTRAHCFFLLPDTVYIKQFIETQTLSSSSL